MSGFKLKKVVLTLLAFCLVVPSSLAAQDRTLPRTVQSLKSLLYSLRPAKNSETESFFQEALSSPTQTAELDKLISSDTFLSQAFEEGRVFRTGYLSNLKTDFTEEGASFFLRPEKTILNWIEKATPTASSVMNQPISEAKASRLAWEDTEARFSLHGLESPSQLEEISRKNVSYREALQFYQKRVYVHQDDEERVTHQSATDLTSVRKVLKDKLHQLRLHNYVRAFERASTESKPLSVKLVSLADGKKVKIADLSHVQVTLNFSAVSETHQALPANQGVGLNRNLLTSLHIDPVAALSGFGNDKIGLFDGETHFTLSEAQGNQLLHNFRPAKIGDQTGESSYRLYLGEAAARDQLIARMLKLVDEETRSVEQLKNQLFAHQRREADFSPSHPLSLTSRAQLSENAVTRDSRLNALRWAGYRKEPNFWWARDKQAYAPAKNPLVVKWRRSEKNVSDQPTENISKQTEPPKVKQKSRLDFSATAKKVGLWSTLAFGLTYGVININSLFVDHGFSINKLFQNHKPITLNNALPYEPTNLSAKSMQDAAKVVAFQLSHIHIDQKEIPQYFNFPSWASDYNADSVDGLGVSLEVGEPVDLSRPAAPADKDFTLETKLPQTPSSQHVPIITPSGFKLTELTLTRNGQPLVYGQDYLVYQNPHNGLLFAKINVWSGIFNYQASFKKEDQFRHVDPLFDRVNPVSLARVSMALEKVGASELSETLERLSRVNRAISYEELADGVANTGVYTFDPPQEMSRPPYSEASISEGFALFYDYAPFLRSGVLYYQCTGSNLLLQQIINFMNSKDLFNGSSEVPQVENVVGYTYAGGDKITAVGHLHTLLFRRDVSHVFRELDGTPNKMDPKYENWKNPISPEEKPKERRDEDLERRARHLFLPTKVEKEVSDERTEEKPEEAQIPEPERLARDLQTIALKEKAALDVVAKLSLQYPALRNLAEAYRTPALRFLSVARVMRESLKGIASPEETLRRLISLDLGYAPFTLLLPFQGARVQERMTELTSETESLDEKIHQKLQQMLSGLEFQIQEERRLFENKGITQNSAFDFLLHEELKKVFTDLAQTLVSKTEKKVGEDREGNCAEQLAF